MITSPAIRLAAPDMRESAELGGLALVLPTSGDVLEVLYDAAQGTTIALGYHARNDDNQLVVLDETLFDVSVTPLPAAA